jgi:O-antigen/teichoic acid export membrane protein
MLQLADFFKGKSFIKRGLKNSSFLALGRVLSGIISLATLIYVTRQLNLEEYGMMVTVNVYIAFFSLINFSGVSSSVMRQGAEDINAMSSAFEETNGFKLLLGVLAITVCLFTLIFTNYETQVKYLIVIFSANLLIDGMYSHWLTVFTAIEKFSYRFIFNISYKLLFFIFAIIFLYYGYNVIALLFINLVLNIARLIACLFFSRQFVRFRLSSLKNITFSKKYIGEGVYFFIISLAGILFAKFDVLMITMLGTTEDVSLYNIPFRITREAAELRIALLAGFFPVMIKQVREQSLSKAKFKKFTFSVLFLILTIATIVSYYSGDLVIFIFGEKFAYSGEILSVLVYFIAVDYAIYPYILVLLASKNEKTVAGIFVVLAIANVLLNYLLFKAYGVIGIAYSTLIVMILLGILTYTIGMKKLIQTKVFA